jgi:uncharacterized protein YfaS (alpha-2-macroglobulin family)
MERCALATAKRQSQFHRRIPAALLVALIACWSVLAAADEPAATEPADLGSNYSPPAGAPFFILADSGFTSSENARLRVEGDNSVFEAYSGLDVVVYRVPQPLEFLQKQSDLHRVTVSGEMIGEGLSNTVNFLSDKWFKKSRILWQQFFAAPVRKAVVEAVPGLHQASRYSYGPVYESLPAYRPLKQFEMVERFRYPVHVAHAIPAPKDLHLQGSSSNFLDIPQGNVYVPLGKLKPGLYFVEAYVGTYRATTVVFVSDTLAVTKVASDGMLVWTAGKTSGRATPDVDLVWSDGSGVLKSDSSDRRGLRLLKHEAPEKSYVFGRDRAGGVFVSENFYYDSEIYDHQFYIFTDRPLYKPGEVVQVKIYAREFLNAHESKAIEPVEASLQMLDAAGQNVLTQKIRIDPVTGGNVALPLPENAYLGGYELRMTHQHAVYAGSFRVSNYVRPHYQVDVEFDRADFHAGETVSGHVALHYPDGAPVQDAAVSLSLKSQALSMVDGDARAGGRFPVKLQEQNLNTGKDGKAAFQLPAAAVPSRYVLKVEATQQGTFPVGAHAELLLPAAPSVYSLHAAGEAKNAKVHFRLESAAKDAAPAAGWEAIRMQDRRHAEGRLGAGAKEFDIDLPGPGNYSLFVRDAKGVLLAQSGYELADSATASAEISGIRLHADKPGYKVGDTANIDIDFPTAPADALFTLERDHVERYAVAGTDEDWLKITRTDKHWRVAVPITEEFRPNVTFSVLAIGKDGYEFQNVGIVVAQPAVDVTIASDKTDYKPGEIVDVTLTAKIEGKPAEAAVLTAGVVDEMVYVLQPEVAPSIFDFFYHPRRDSVRTSSSLNFFGYDLAWSPNGTQAGSFDYRQRVTKIPLRSRRENLDTAAWEPTLRTDKEGRAHFSFTMPDALTRWRITVRAMSHDGLAGQSLGYVNSNQPIHLRWTGPTRFRSGDKPKIGVVAFNETPVPVKATLQITAVDAEQPQRELTLQTGSNFIDLPLLPQHDVLVGLTLSDKDKVYDKLDVPLHVDASGWPSAHSRDVDATATLGLPADATNLRLHTASGMDDLMAALEDDLIDYPYGCVEQTASRLIPLAMSLEGLDDDPASSALKLRLQQRIQTARGRLMSLAGPKSEFTWWGDAASTSATDGNAAQLLLTVYAYYADWRASRSLGIVLPADHWQRVVDTYARLSASTSLLHRALAVWMMQDMGLPVQTLVKGLGERLADTKDPSGPPELQPASESVVMNAATDYDENDDLDGRTDLSLLLWRSAAQRAKLPLDAKLVERANKAHTRLLAMGPVHAAMAQALDSDVDLARAQDVLQHLDTRMPTFERALVLAWTHDAVARATKPGSHATWQLGKDWQAVSANSWVYRGKGVPDKIEFTAPPGAGARAHLSFDSATDETTKLAGTLERHLYKLVPEENAENVTAFTAKAVDGPVQANQLYIDEVVLSTEKLVQFAIVEIPLPPGAQLEPQRFGFSIPDLQPLPEGDRASAPEGTEDATDSTVGQLTPQYAQVFENSYAVPLEQVTGKRVLRHLVRFGMRGNFNLPPARFYPMYAPTAKVQENSGGAAWVIQ